MPLMIRLNRVMNVPDNEVNSYMANGYKPYDPAASVQEQATSLTDTEKFQAAVTAEVEKRMEGIPSQADFESAVTAEVERRLKEIAEMQPPIQETEEGKPLQPSEKTGGKGGKANATSGEEK